MNERIDVLENKLKHDIETNKSCEIVKSMPGIGIINTSALIASIDQGQAFKTPREFGVWLGLPPNNTVMVKHVEVQE